ncbi:MAG: SLC13 family permease [Desulfosarcinaceae bacterium]
MTLEMVLTLVILAFAVALFVFEWVRVDVVGIIMMVLLPLTGLISAKEAFIGLSSNAVCSIIAVIIIGAGLDKTGVMNQVAGPIIKLAGNSENRVISLISGTVGVISSMMQNIGAAALFMPAAQRIAKRMDVPVSRILMPMSSNRSVFSPRRPSASACWSAPSCIFSCSASLSCRRPRARPIGG